MPADAAAVTLPARLTAGGVAVALATATLGGALASWLSAWRAARPSPAEALRHAG